ncbi:MAG: hypothetical protein MJ252_07740 [archaeon]|nr:hypothetical protein [archaeon]
MQRNRQYGQSSDIFGYKNLNKPEYNPPPTKLRLHNNYSSSDLLTWKKLPAQTEQKPIRVHRSPPKITTQPERRLCLARSTTGKRTQSKVFFGNDDNRDIVVRRQKPPEYDPSKYFRNQERTAIDRKYRELAESELDGRGSIRKNLNDEMSERQLRPTKSSSTIGTIRKEFSENKPNFYLGPRGISNIQPETGKDTKRGTLKRDMMKQNSSGFMFDKDKRTKTLKVDNLKSNIFNDPDKETINKIDSTKDFFNGKNKEVAYRRRPKTNRIGEEQDNFITTLDWKDDKTNLFFKSPEHYTEKKPIDRKMDEFYGKGTMVSPKHNKPQKEADDNMRSDLLKKFTSQTPKAGVAKIKKRIENMAYYQNQPACEGITVVRKAPPQKEEEQKYELKNFSDSKDVNMNEVEQTFRKKGLHIYGIKNETGVGGYGKKGRITFNVRDGGNGGYLFKRKMNDAKREIKQKNGYDIGNYAKDKKIL